MATIDKLREILAECQCIDPALVREECTFEEVGMDSLDLIDFTYEVEDAFGLTVKDLDSIQTFGDVVAYIDSL